MFMYYIMLYIYYTYFCQQTTPGLWIVHPRVMSTMPAPTVCNCHNVAYKSGSLSIKKYECEIKKISNTTMNGNVNLDANTMTLTDLINRVDCISKCLDYSVDKFNYIDQ